VVTPTYVPQHADAVWLTFDPQAGSEQAGRRPALVLSPSSYNGRSGLTLCCPITSRAKGYPFEVPVPPGLAVTGVILADQIKCMDWRARRVDFICPLPTQTVQQVLAKLATLLPGI
jgi:mRNA interferase MazF